MASFTDGYWWSNDGLRLHYRDYPGRDDRPPILCIPGLTRNARDFEDVAARLSPEWRLICVELRGRGESAYAKDPMTYVPLTYLQDIGALIRELKLERFVAFGTSLGGIITMLLAPVEGQRLAGALINDIGPVIEERGLDRIKAYVGRSQSWPTWLHAARHFQEVQGEIYPDWPLEQWLVMAKRLCRLNAAGRIVLDYDMRIAEPMKLPGSPAGFDPWPAFQTMAGRPILVLHGGTSDILSKATAERMQAEVSELELVTLPDRGHAPSLDEPEAQAAIDRLLARVVSAL